MSQQPEFSRDLKLKNRLGLHARPAALLVQLANRYNAEIKIKKEEKEIDGKNILGVMTLAANQGSVLSFSARGKDAAEALDAIEKMFEDKFGEK